MTTPTAESARPAPMSVSTRPDGRFITTGGFLAHHFKNHKPKLAFNPRFTPAEATAWRKQVRARLKKVLAFPRVPKQPAPKLISSDMRDGYTLQRWELYPEPFCVVPMLMLIPDTATAKKPAPGVLCLPGSDHPKEFLAGEPAPGNWQSKFGEHDKMALHFVRQGCVALVLDNAATAELEDPRVKHWARMSSELTWIGRSYESLNTFHKYVALQWFKKLPFVASNKIGVSGFSLGGKVALLLGLLDDSLGAVVWNSSMYSFLRRPLVTGFLNMAPWQYIPDLVTWFDCIDLMAALAPTPFLVSEGGREEDAAIIRKSYALAGARNGFKLTYMPNYSDPAARTHDRLPVPEGIDANEFAKFHNFDDDHYFKDEVVVPWVCKALRARS